MLHLRQRLLNAAMIKARAVMTFQSILFKFRIAPQRGGMLDRQNRGAGKIQGDPNENPLLTGSRRGMGWGWGGGWVLFSALLTVIARLVAVRTDLAALAGAFRSISV